MLDPVILNKLHFTNKSIYSAAAYSLISQNITESSVDDAFALADRRTVFDELAYDLAGVDIANSTAAAAFENLSDSTAIASNLTLVNYINDSDYLIEKFKASTVAKNNFGERYIKSLDDINYLKHYNTVDVNKYLRFNPYSFAFSSDGTKVFFLNISTDTVYSFTLTTAWDLNTLTPDNIVFFASAIVATGDSTDLAFSSDGTKMYIAVDTGYIYQYNLSTAWNISTATYNSSDDVRSQFSAMAIYFCLSSDGTKMYVLSPSLTIIARYNLSVAWSINTASYVNSFTMPNSGHDSIAISSDGTKVITSYSNSIMRQYDLGTAYDITTAVLTLRTMPTSLFEAPRYASLRYSGSGDKFYGLTIYGYAFQFALTTTWNLESDRETKTKLLAQDSSPSNLAFSADGTKLYILGTNSDRVRQYELSTAWDITTASYDVDRFASIAAQDLTAYFLAFSPDGLNMYIGGATNDRIYQYTLSTPWDVSTATFLQNSNLISSQEPSTVDVHFKPDGTRLYVIGTNADRIYEYLLTTPWDITTLTYSGNSLFVGSGALGTQTPQGISFSPDGNKIIIGDPNHGKLYNITLATSWDLNSSYYHTEDSINISHQSGITTSTDGTYLYTRSGTTFTQTKLFQPGSVKPMLLDPLEQSTFLGSAINCVDFDFSADGTKLFLLTSTLIKEYNVRVPFNASTITDSGKQHTHGLTSPKCLRVTKTGYNIYIAANTSQLALFNLFSPFDIANITFVNNYSYGTINTNIDGLEFSSDGRFLYLIGLTGGAKIYKLEIVGLPYTVTSVSRGSIKDFGLQPNFIRFVDNDFAILFSEGTNILSKAPLKIAGDLETVEYEKQESIGDFAIYYGSTMTLKICHMSDKYINFISNSSTRIHTHVGREVNHMKHVE